MFFVNPLNSAFGVQQDGAKVGSGADSKSRFDKVRGLFSESFRGMLRNEARQMYAAARVGTIDDDDACAQAFSRRVAERKLAQVDGRHGPSAIIEKTGKARWRLGNLLKFE